MTKRGFFAKGEKSDALWKSFKELYDKQVIDKPCLADWSEMCPFSCCQIVDKFISVFVEDTFIHGAEAVDRMMHFGSKKRNDVI